MTTAKLTPVQRARRFAVEAASANCCSPAAARIRGGLLLASNFGLDFGELRLVADELDKICGRTTAPTLLDAWCRSYTAPGPQRRRRTAAAAARGADTGEAGAVAVTATRN